MFVTLKQKIKQLAQSAVAIAEQSLGTAKGQEKKKMAVEYIIEHLPLSPFFKRFVAFVLSGFIDNAVEYAVEYMNGLKNNGENYE